MKKLVTVALVALVGTTAMNAQIGNKGGLHLAYGSEVEAIGVGVNGEFGVAPKISIAPSFTYFFPSEDGIDLTSFELNVDGHYYFVQDASFNFYGLAGLNFSYIKAEIDGYSIAVPGQDAILVPSSETDDNDFGINVGAGFTYDMDAMVEPFAEIKYTAGGYDQVVLSAGVRWGF